jgi:hypothetical protein
MKSRSNAPLALALALALATLGLTATRLSALTLPEAGSEEEEHAALEHEEETHSSGLRLGRQASWIFRSFLRDETDDATTLGLEFESYIGAGKYEIKNISYFEVAEYPRAIPGQPPGNESPGTVADDGINDLLTAFWISKKGHHGKHHFSPGLAAQFPTASSDVLGSGKWSLGPSFDYEYESGRWFAGAIALQVWSVAGESDRKDVNMLMIKPFAYYSLSEKWDLMYVPYGIQVYWNKPSGEKVYLPVGGGAQRHFQVGSAQMNLGLAYYYNVVRPTKGTVSDLRLLVEFNF